MFKFLSFMIGMAVLGPLRRAVEWEVFRLSWRACWHVILGKDEISLFLCPCLPWHSLSQYDNTVHVTTQQAGPSQMLTRCYRTFSLATQSMVHSHSIRTWTETDNLRGRNQQEYLYITSLQCWVEKCVSRQTSSGLCSKNFHKENSKKCRFSLWTNCGVSVRTYSVTGVRKLQPA